jgi:hypothetical protein
VVVGPTHEPFTFSRGEAADSGGGRDHLAFDAGSFAWPFVIVAVQSCGYVGN